MNSTPSSTCGCDDDLPRLPIPDLAASATEFLAWCTPLLTEDELADTRAAVSELLAADSPGRAGYARIQAFDATPGVHSWLDDFWRDRYLGRRVRTAINANFFYLFRDGPGNRYERAAGLIMGVLDHKRAVDEGRLPVTVQRGRALSMVQHRYLFSSTRIPGPDRDRARTPHSKQWPGPSGARHVVVLIDGHLFGLDVIGADGAPHTLDELGAALAEIAESVTDRGQGVGHLTSLDRADWAQARDRLLGLHPDNRETMDAVERALIGICLEAASPEGPEAACNELLAGDSGNRWYDKAVSLVVFPDGRAGLQGEHGELDGTTIAELVDAIMGPTDSEHQRGAGARPQAPPSWRRLDFVLDDDLRADIQRAQDSFDAFKAQTVGRMIELHGVGSDVPKQLSVSPDAFAQIAFQLAHHRARGFVGATYESVSMRHFHHGRTEAMRVVTPEIVSFIDAMADSACGRTERAAMARAAAAEHVVRAQRCQEGHAPEQLIWELQCAERRRGLDSGLSIYQSPGWRIMRDDCLSTSSAPAAHAVISGFGATGGRCIGVAYQMLPQRLTLYLSTPAPIADEMSRFAEELPRAIDELAAVLRVATDAPPAGGFRRRLPRT